MSGSRIAGAGSGAGAIVAAVETAASSSSDFWLLVARGLVPGHSEVTVRGHNPSQSAASGFVDVSEQGNLVYLSAAETMELASTSTEDAPGGTGLEAVFISGVDDSGDLASETVTLNGTIDVRTANSYLRINTMVGLGAGSAGWNVGDITATATTAGTIQDEMDANESISQSSHYTVPNGHSLAVLKAELNVARLSGGSAPVVEVRAYGRVGVGSAWIQLFDKRLDAGASVELDVTPPVPFLAAAGSEFRFRTDTDSNNTEIRTRMLCVLIENGAA